MLPIRLKVLVRVCKAGPAFELWSQLVIASAKPIRRRRANRLAAKDPSPRAKTRRMTSSALILRDLRNDIMALHRAPGTAINEKEIASAYGVSRTPVREALLKLAEEGLIDIFPQSGTFVSRIPLYALRENIVVRQALEMMSARLAAEQETEEKCRILDENMARLQVAADQEDHDAFHNVDEEFHSAIADIAGYPGLWRMSQLVKVQMDRCRRLTLPQAGRLQRVIAEHQLIVDAIRKNDSSGASETMADHLEKLMADLDGIRDIDPDYFVNDPR